MLTGAELHDCVADLTGQGPGLRLVASASDPRRPGIEIDGELIRDGPHVALLLRQEIVHEPAILDAGPLDVPGLGLQDLAEGLAGGTVEAGAVRESLDVAAVLRGHEALAGLGGLAGGEEGPVDGDVAFIVEVEEREQGGGVCLVQDGEDGVAAVVAHMDGDVA